MVRRSPTKMPIQVGLQDRRPDTPRGYAIETDDKRIFTGGDVPDNYNFAYLSDDAVWTSIKAPPSPDRYITFGYDPGHHVMYVANHTAGLLRVVTQ
jgi:hypothetical protein